MKRTRNLVLALAGVMLCLLLTNAVADPDLPASMIAHHDVPDDVMRVAVVGFGEPYALGDLELQPDRLYERCEAVLNDARLLTRTDVDFDGVREATLDSIGRFDPWTGKLDPEAEREAQAVAARTVVHESGADIVVRLRLAPRIAELTGITVSWDGVERELHFLGNERLARHADLGGTGRALSVEVLAYDAEGTLLYQGYGGVTSLQLIEGREGITRFAPFDVRPNHDVDYPDEALRVALAPVLDKSAHREETE